MLVAYKYLLANSFVLLLLIESSSSDPSSARRWACEHEVGHGHGGGLGVRLPSPAQTGPDQNLSMADL